MCSAVFFHHLTDTMVGLSKQEIVSYEAEERKKEKEVDNALLMLVQTTIKAVAMEEAMSINEKMERYRSILAKGVVAFAGGHEDARPKMERFVDSFRAGWKAFKQNEDEKATLDVFMKAMNNELWVEEGVEVAR